MRELIVARVRRRIAACISSGDPADVAHILLAIAQGLILQESAGWLGSSNESMNRRWSLAIAALVNGLSSARQGRG